MYWGWPGSCSGSQLIEGHAEGIRVSLIIVMRVSRRVLFLILVLLYSGWVVSPVSAHAVLLRSNPEANTVLSQAPVQVELFFTEPLEPNLSSIQVFDASGRIVDAGDARVDPTDPTRMTVTLHALSDGVYTVNWKALSTIDGHQTVGSFSFAVGNENAAAVASIPESSTARIPFTALLSKFLLLASLVLLVGQWLFRALLWDPVVKDNPVGEPEIWYRLQRIALSGVLVAVGIGMLSQAGQSLARELSFPWQPETGRILTETRLGSIWLTRLILAMLVVWMMDGHRSRWQEWASFALNLALLLTVTLTSHAATDTRPFFPILADWLHLVGTAFWLGGLVYLFTGLRHLQRSEAPAHERLPALLTSRFSVHAFFFVGLIGLTGLYSAYLRVGSVSALLGNLYGHTLLLKQLFVLGLLLIAAFNLLIISPRLKRHLQPGEQKTRVVSRFSKSLSVEMTFAALLLANVTFLTYVPPAKSPSVNTGITRSVRVESLRLELTITPGRIGQNTFTLHLEEDEQAVLSAREVLLRFTPLQSNIAPSELELISQGDGSYSARGTSLSTAGPWQIQAVVRREGRFDAFANFDISLRSSEAGQQSAAQQRQTGLLLFGIGLLAGILSVSSDISQKWQLGLGAPLAVLLVGMGIYYLVSPPSAPSALANPIPPDAASIARGRELYMAECALCHGETGRGDGVVGLTLDPPPADLAQHAVPGVHTDAQLFEWISNGFPGSQMPPFRSALSDTDRWHLVNFIRTFASP